MNSVQTSQQHSQASSRMQSPLVYKNIPKHPWSYTIQKFINKIPPTIRYGLPGIAIGAIGTKLYQAAQNQYNKLQNTTKPLTKEDRSISSNQKNIDTSVKPRETPIPRSTFNPAHPRTGYRYFPYLN